MGGARAPPGYATDNSTERYSQARYSPTEKGLWGAFDLAWSWAL